MSLNLERMAQTTKRERELWLIALGACLASEEFRKLFLSEMSPGDSCQADIEERLHALRKSESRQVWSSFESFGVHRDGEKDTVLAAIRRRLSGIVTARGLRNLAEKIVCSYAAGEHSAALEAAGDISKLVSTEAIHETVSG